MRNSIKVNPFFLQKSNDRQRITDRLTDQVNYILDALLIGKRNLNKKCSNCNRENHNPPKRK